LVKPAGSEGALAKVKPSQKPLDLIGVKIPTTEQVEEELSFREATLPPSVRELRQKLGQKAKQQKRFRFYSLYGLVCRLDVLQTALAAVRRNGGAPGVDRVTIEQVTATPATEAKFLGELQKSLQEKTYRAQAVRRVYIPKGNGKLRPLGIPTVVDRVAQAAVLLILEPIFEADFHECSHGFRPGRSAHDALKTIDQHLKGGRTAVYDADLAGYFDSIPQDKLIAAVRMRVVDGSILGLIRQWLSAPVVEPTKDGQPPTVRRNDRGTPQGGVLSPLLANVYRHWFDHVFHRADGPAQWAKAKLIRYADDFVVLARVVDARLQGWIEEKLEGWLGLQINRDKTRIVDLRQPDTSLDFLGYTFRLGRDRYGRRLRYWQLEPSRKALAREREALRGLIHPGQSHTPLPELIARVNRNLRGCGNYFRLGRPRRAFGAINHFVRSRLGKHLHRRSQRGWRPREGVSLYAHLKQLGLHAL
jgi:RNA-directed DNA polymerase